MASYTYSLTDNGDGAVSTYFGTASMAAFNNDQSTEFVESYVESNLVVNSSELLWSGDSNETPSPAEYSATEYLKISYLTPSQPLMSTTTFANVNYIEPDADYAIFAWNYLSYIKKYNYKDLSINWYIEGVSLDDIEDPEKLASFYLQEAFELSTEDLGIEDTEITVVFYQNLVTYTTNYNSDIAIYQNYGISDPTVYAATTSDTANEQNWECEYSYKSGELAGIRAKFASPADSTSLSLMQAVISSSVDKIYNTSNISRFNFKKTRAEIQKPRNVSSIDLIKDFNRPYGVPTSG